jgi:hypothetical protein
VCEKEVQAEEMAKIAMKSVARKDRQSDEQESRQHGDKRRPHRAP